MTRADEKVISEHARSRFAKVRAFEQDGTVRVPGMARCVVGTK